MLSSASASAFSQRVPPVVREDHYGLIIQTDGNVGDTAQREGWAWFGKYVRDCILHKPWSVKRSISYATAMDLLEIDHSGIFRRHPDSSIPQDFSRDQSIAIIAAMGIWNDSDRLKRFYDKTVARKFQAQNGDAMTPDIVSLFDRAANTKPGPVGDIAFLFADVNNRISAAADPDNTGDDLNLILRLLMAKLRFPYTAPSSPAGINTQDMIDRYVNGRPLSYGSYLKAYRLKNGIHYNGQIPIATVRKNFDDGIRSGWRPECPPVIGALRYYFREESYGNPELAELYAPIIEDVFSHRAFVAGAINCN